jgi:hypothetical protein
MVANGHLTDIPRASGECVLKCRIPMRATNHYLPFQAKWS